VTGRRLLVLLVVLAAIGIPAGILQAMCVGGSCAADPGESSVPFCPLPDALKVAIANGYREGRSADVLAIGATTPIFTQVDGLRLPWPAVSTATDPRVPVAFSGAGISAGAPIPDGVALDTIAPTVASALGFERPFPEVRSGTAIDGVASTSGERPRLILLIAWKGVGSSELEDLPAAWPFLASMLLDGAGTLEAEAGSLPLDPSATLTTTGTGGLPAQHGITGSFIRNDAGSLVEAYGEGAPVSVIASLADDLEDADPRTLVGLVASDESDRGLVGGGWYPDQDPVDAVFGDALVAPLAVQEHLSSGYGADDVPDVLGVVLEGGIGRMERLTRRIVAQAQEATAGATLVVVAGTGTWERSMLAVEDEAAVDAVEDAIPGDASAVEAAVPGGLFLDQAVLREQKVTGQVAVDALLEAEDPNGERMMADAFQGFAVSFARYC
jgi:hypothetical protein